MKLLSTIRLTDSQKRVIAKIAAAPTPQVAGTEISKDANLVGARNLLMKLGAITLSDQAAELTDRGQQLGVESNIIDDSGQLTDIGTKFAGTLSNGQPDQEDAAPPAPGGDMNGGMDQGMGIGMDDPSTQPPTDDKDMSLESLTLLKQLLS